MTNKQRILKNKLVMVLGGFGTIASNLFAIARLSYRLDILALLAFTIAFGCTMFNIKCIIELMAFNRELKQGG